jgi:hypothetical protein
MAVVALSVDPVPVAGKIAATAAPAVPSPLRRAAPAVAAAAVERVIPVPKPDLSAQL